METAHKQDSSGSTEFNRRDFIEFAALGLAATTVAGCANSGSRQATRGASFELKEATVADLTQSMASGERTSRSICEAYLTRIETDDRQGSRLQSMLDLNPDTFDIADQLDAERAAGRLRGSLHGIPVIIKDNIDTADRMTTTAGSLALEGSIASEDSFVVQRLREAGAIVIGKANLSEWANFRSTRSSSGWSGRGGQCNNPYALDRNPCGSSAGTGAAVSANFAVIGVGTETDGSVVCPSATCGLVGIKPTVGLVSRTGIIPISHTQDTAGPMARTVTDAAILLGAMAGLDPRDNATEGARIEPDYTQYLDTGGLRGARIGVARNVMFGRSLDADKIAEEAIDAMRDAGAVIVDPAEIPNTDEYGDSEFEVMLYEFKAGLNAYLSRLTGTVTSLADVIAFNETNSDRSMPYFGQEILLMAEEKGPLTDSAYLDALARNRRYSRAEGIDAVMDQHRLDALVTPTTSPAWTTDLVNGDHYLGGSSSPAAVSGYPNITVPAGFAHGLPVGISVFGRSYSEGTLIRIAYAFEQTTNARTAPGMLPTLRT